MVGAKTDGGQFVSKWSEYGDNFFQVVSDRTALQVGPLLWQFQMIDLLWHARDDSPERVRSLHASFCGLNTSMSLAIFNRPNHSYCLSRSNSTTFTLGRIAAEYVLGILRHNVGKFANGAICWAQANIRSNPISSRLAERNIGFTHWPYSPKGENNCYGAQRSAAHRDLSNRELANKPLGKFGSKVQR